MCLNIYEYIWITTLYNWFCELRQFRKIIEYLIYNYFMQCTQFMVNIIMEGYTNGLLDNYHYL